MHGMTLLGHVVTQTWPQVSLSKIWRFPGHAMHPSADDNKKFAMEAKTSLTFILSKDMDENNIDLIIDLI